MNITQLGTPGKPRQLWLHGFLGRGDDWQEPLGPWMDDYEFLCPDLPGHGDSPPDALSPTLQALAELARGCELAGGYSMGGRLMMMAAARFPEAFRALVIESAAPGYADANERAARAILDGDRADRLRAGGLPAFVEDWYAAPFWASLREDPERLRRIVARRSEGHAESLAQAMETFGPAHQPDLQQWLRYTTCPVLWLAGSKDAAYVATAEEVRLRMPRIMVKIISGAGHNTHLEQPEAWRDAVSAFCTAQTYGKENRIWQQ